MYRYMGFGSVKTAWMMAHKIRLALVEENTDKLGGIVEVDETWTGGKNANKHVDKKVHGRGGKGFGQDARLLVLFSVRATWLLACSTT